MFPYFLIEAVFFAVWRLLKIIYFTWYFISSFLNRYVHFFSNNWSIFKNSDSFFIKIRWHQASFIRARSTTASKSSSVFVFVFFSPSLLLHCLLTALRFTSIMSGKSYLLLWSLIFWFLLHLNQLINDLKTDIFQCYNNHYSFKYFENTCPNRP